MSRQIRIDAEVRRELDKRKRYEDSYSDVVGRVIERFELERALSDRGLSTPQMARLFDLRMEDQCAVK